MQNKNIFNELSQYNFELIWMQEENYIFENNHLTLKIKFDSKEKVEGNIQFEFINYFKSWSNTQIFYFNNRKEFDFILKKILN